MIVAIVCLLTGFVAGVVATICTSGCTSCRAAGNREAADNRTLRIQNQQCLAELHHLRETARAHRCP